MTTIPLQKPRVLIMLVLGPIGGEREREIYIYAYIHIYIYTEHENAPSPERPPYRICTSVCRCRYPDLETYVPLSKPFVRGVYPDHIGSSLKGY